MDELDSLDAPLFQAARTVVPVDVTEGDMIEPLRECVSGRCISVDRTLGAFAVGAG